MHTIARARLVLRPLHLHAPPPPLTRLCPHPLQDAIEEAVRDTLKKAGPGRHILNLGHGVLVGTPEEAVGHMFDLSKQLKYADLH